MVPLTLLEIELPIPPVGFFGIAFVIFLVALAALLSFGKSRPHS